MEQVALNTVFAVMMAIFPGFLFRKCYYRGEFTKQFSQSNEFDKLLWNVFFSGVSIGITFLSIYFFRTVSKLEMLPSLSYDTIEDIAKPISKNDIPKKDVFFKTYKDLIFITFLIYSFACFLGLTLHWMVRTLGLDTRFSLFRFKNYWYYYLHGGRILYSSPGKNKLAFTVVDVLCEVAGETKLYKGVLSQYTINKEDNSMENIFLSNARSLKQVKDENGNTVEVKSRDIPGAVFCIPYKNVANMNLIYVYKEIEETESLKKALNLLLNIIIFISSVVVIASLWFDLSSLGIKGLWHKVGYVWWAFLGLTNLRLLCLSKRFLEAITHGLIVISSTLWVTHYKFEFTFWIPIAVLLLAAISAGITGTGKPDSPEEQSTR